MQRNSDISRCWEIYAKLCGNPFLGLQAIRKKKQRHNNMAFFTLQHVSAIQAIITQVVNTLQSENFITVINLYIKCVVGT
jgi:hypothetical protein